MSSEDNAVKGRASERLLSTFGDMKAVAEFVEKHKIKV
ncbi:Uncharacterised protein [Zhongshania aliphaticivorans]|uniref:Uncharacterized protein n=2 Tax=Zhongshania aliphaticivorans TaxID=1470434 RepID=A0A5S9PR93_9GAMM|nr:Uncharacterised protein [Zhongshania aliphaticivorans]